MEEEYDTDSNSVPSDCGTSDPIHSVLRRWKISDNWLYGTIAVASIAVIIAASVFVFTLFDNKQEIRDQEVQRAKDGIVQACVQRNVTRQDTRDILLSIVTYTKPDATQVNPFTNLLAQYIEDGMGSVDCDPNSPTFGEDPTPVGTLAEWLSKNETPK